MHAFRPRLVTILLLGLGGCVPGPAVDLTPEAAVQVCEAPTVLALRAKDAGFRSLTLEPAATSRVEKRRTQVGRQPVAMVVSGHGTAQQTAGSTDIRYLCLIAPSGEALFVDVTVANGATILAECATPPRRHLPARMPERSAAGDRAGPCRGRGQGGHPCPQ